MAEKRNEKRDTKQAIFMSAAKLFAEKGFLGVSMRDIAADTGIKAASIYNHYASKEELLDDLLVTYLNRMTYFYKRLAQQPFEADELHNLGKVLNKLMLSYEPKEMQLMYWLTRIVHHEQFNDDKAAQALIGEGYREYMLAHEVFFNRLSDAGMICGKQDNRFYAEIYARLSLTFATQFLHPEVEPTIPDQTVLSDFVNDLVIANEMRKQKAAQAG